MAQLRVQNKIRSKYLEQRGYTVVVVSRTHVVAKRCVCAFFLQKWEHELHEDIKCSKEFRDFVQLQGGLKTPIKPREALQGGRVNAVKLYYETSENECINYLDVNKTCLDTKLSIILVRSA